MDFKRRLNISSEDVNFILMSKGVIKQKDLSKKYNLSVSIIHKIQSKHPYYS